MARYNPRSLVRLSETVINRAVVNKESICKLELPNCLYQGLLDNYLEDRLTCEELLYENIHYGYNFNQHWQRLTDDEYVYLMSWIYYPYFADTINHVSKLYFDIHDIYVREDINQEETRYSRLCHFCVIHLMGMETRERTLRWVEFNEECGIYTDEEALSYVQCEENWCSRCLTTTLFTIETASRRPHEHCRFKVHSIARYERVDGQWSSATFEQ